MSRNNLDQIGEYRNSQIITVTILAVSSETVIDEIMRRPKYKDFTPNALKKLLFFFYPSMNEPVNITTSSSQLGSSRFLSDLLLLGNLILEKTTPRMPIIDYPKFAFFSLFCFVLIIMFAI